MSRSEAQIRENESEIVLKRILPRNWIVRKLPEDYGVDYEIEIVDSKIVTGNKIYVQLKSTKVPLRISDRVINKMGEEINRQVISYRLKTKFIKYVLRSSFPLLLFLVDLNDEEIYWIPLKNYIEVILIKRDNWSNQKTNTIEIPLQNNFTHESVNNYFGLRWFALEPARMYSLTKLSYYLHEMNVHHTLNWYEFSDGYIDEFDEKELLLRIKTDLFYLQLSLQMDVLFGDNGLDIFTLFLKPRIIASIEKGQEVLQDILKNFTFETLSQKIFTDFDGFEALSLCIPTYLECNMKFL